MTSSNACGECDMCCRLLAIEVLEKPPGPLCGHFQDGCCSVYQDRPDACRGFHCLWLKSERLTPEVRMSPQWRPDRAKFMMYSEHGDRRLNVVVDADHPQAWTREPYYGFLKRLSHRVAEGYELLVFVGDRRIVIFPDEDVDLGPVKPEDEIVFGYAQREGRRVPYARIGGALAGR
jgi:hypothetical protein